TGQSLRGLRAPRQQGAERDRSYSGGRAAEQLPAGEHEVAFPDGIHCRVITSSRFRMTLAAVVYAANSAGSMDRSRGDSPPASSFSAKAVSVRYCARRRLRPSSRIRTSASVAGREVAARNAQERRCAEEDPPSFTIRSANLRAVSMYISSLSSASACSGVELI